ncbi:MAG: HAMP domain-containing sensor histidine kinase [Anaerolineaceae bacterium]|nr:HAMP domain-containing sensor histidine kinase [Anaerolineaceae bacterium]
MTFRKRLILYFSGLLAIFILVFGVLVYTVLDSALMQSVDRRLEETATLVINNSRGLSSLVSTQRVIVLPRLDIFSFPGVGVQVWSVDDDPPQLEASSNNIATLVLPLNESALGATEPVYANVTLNEHAVRVLTSPMIAGGELLANVQLVMSLQAMHETRQNLLLVMGLGGILVVLASIAGGLWLSQRALRPIRRITLAAASIARTDDLDTRLEWQGPRDDLGRLVSVFNDMMARLQGLFSVQQRFVADVSHELRTPLTAIRGNLDLIRRYGMDEPSLEAIESEAGRMARMVDDLLLLARADYGGLALELKAMDLDTLLLEARREAQLLAGERQLDIELRRLEPLRARGNADRIKQLLLNLLDNAIKFTPDGGKITLGLYRDGHDAVLEVADSGIGIAPEDRQRIYDRFWQADPSRRRAQQRGQDAGLGLSIVKWIVDAHQGRIGLVSTPGEGTTFRVRLPLAPETPAQPPQTEPARGARLRHAWLRMRGNGEVTPRQSGDAS